MQTIWKGTVSFGLVSIPVRLYAATEERDISFRQVHREDSGRIRYKRICELDGKEVAYGDIAKGYELPDGRMVLLEREDFEQLPLSSSKIIDVQQFVAAEELDPLMMARAYYLSAEGPGVKPYVLLRDALTRTDRVALVKVALRNREQLAAVRPRGDVLVLQTMLWPDEIRDTAAVAPDEDVTVREQEVAMAESYIETLTADFDPDAFTDEYRGALEEVIAAKAEGLPMPEQEEAPPAEGNVVDLMAALRASVEAAKARRAAAGGDGETATKSSGRSSVRDHVSRQEAGGAGRAGAASGGAEGSEEDAETPAQDGGRRRRATSKASTSRKSPPASSSAVPDDGESAEKVSTAPSKPKRTTERKPARKRAAGATESAPTQADAAKSASEQSEETGSKARRSTATRSRRSA